MGGLYIYGDHRSSSHFTKMRKQRGIPCKNGVLLRTAGGRDRVLSGKMSMRIPEFIFGDRIEPVLPAAGKR